MQQKLIQPEENQKNNYEPSYLKIFYMIRGYPACNGLRHF